MRCIPKIILMYGSNRTSHAIVFIRFRHSQSMKNPKTNNHTTWNSIAIKVLLTYFIDSPGMRRVDLFPMFIAISMNTCIAPKNKYMLAGVQYVVTLPKKGNFMFYIFSILCFLGVSKKDKEKVCGVYSIAIRACRKKRPFEPNCRRIPWD